MPRDLATVLDIALACEDIEEFIQDLEEGDFRTSKLVQSAVLHQLQIVGEATKRLSHSFRDSHPEIPWKAMAGMRDRLIHQYDKIHVSTVWKIASREIPQLRQQLQPLLPLATDPPEGDGT